MGRQTRVASDSNARQCLNSREVTNRFLSQSSPSTAPLSFSVVRRLGFFFGRSCVVETVHLPNAALIIDLHLS